MFAAVSWSYGSRISHRLAVTLPDLDMAPSQRLGGEGGPVGRSESFNIEINGRYVRVAGEVDIRTAPTVEETLWCVGDPLLLDLADVTFMDSQGLNMLMRLRRRRPLMRVIAVAPRVEHLLFITDTRFLLQHPSLHDGRIH